MRLRSGVTAKCSDTTASRTSGGTMPSEDEVKFRAGDLVRDKKEGECKVMRYLGSYRGRHRYVALRTRETFPIPTVIYEDEMVLSVVVDLVQNHRRRRG